MIWSVRIIALYISWSLCLLWITPQYVLSIFGCSVVLNFTKWGTFLFHLLLYVIYLCHSSLAAKISCALSGAFLPFWTQINIWPNWRQSTCSFIENRATIRIMIVLGLPWSIGVHSSCISNHWLRELTLSFMNNIKRQVLANVLYLIVHPIYNVLVLLVLIQQILINVILIMLIGCEGVLLVLLNALVLQLLS